MKNAPSVYVPGHGFVSMVAIKRLLDLEAARMQLKSRGVIKRLLDLGAAIGQLEARLSKPQRRIVKGRRS